MPLGPVASSPRQLCLRTALVACAIAITINSFANLPPAGSTAVPWSPPPTPGPPGTQLTLAVAVAVGDRTPRATHQLRARTHLHACFNDSGTLTLNIATDRPPAYLSLLSCLVLFCAFLFCPFLGFGPFFLGSGEVVSWGFSPQMDSGEDLCSVLSNLPGNRPPPFGATAASTLRSTETGEGNAQGDRWEVGWAGAPGLLGRPSSQWAVPPSSSFPCRTGGRRRRRARCKAYPHP